MKSYDIEDNHVILSSLLNEDFCSAKRFCEHSLKFDAISKSGELSNDFQRFIIPSLIINNACLCEFYINQILRNFSSRTKFDKHKISNKNNRPSLVEKFHSYVTNEKAIDLDDVAEDHSLLKQLNLIRNRFVHNGGHLKDDDNISNELINVEAGLIIPTKEFVYQTLSSAETYLSTCIERLSQIK